MLRSLWLIGLYASFIGLGFTAPFVATLGYVWVDTFQPQYLAYFMLNAFPVAMVMGVAAFALYLLMDRRSPPPLTLETVILLLLLLYITLSMTWAVKTEAAWVKWDLAFKMLLFAAFLPYSIRSRVQIEAFVSTYIFSLAANFVPFGLKTMISGGGYGVNLGLQVGNAGLAEGGLLSTVCLMTVPLTLFLAKHGQLIPRLPMMSLAYWGVAGLAVATAVGTYERSALIGLLVLLAFMVAQSKHKVGYGLVAGAIITALVLFTSSAWNARISTLHDYSREGSAYIRLAVWRWTMEYVAAHPQGGGFMVFLINHIEIPGFDGGDPTIQFGRAFHSIYFEVLGEQGVPGLALFLAITATAFYRLRRTAKRARAYPELEWVSALAGALQSGMAVFLSAGAFVGIAFQPMYWYFIAMSVSLNAYFWRVERGMAPAPAGWRAAGALLPSGGWRNRSTSPPIGSATRTR